MNIREFLGLYECMLGDVTSTQHSAHCGESVYNPFEATSFVYMFALFNTLYNVDWEESYSRNYLWYNRNIGERRQINKLIDFCYQGKDSRSMWQSLGSLCLSSDPVEKATTMESLSQITKDTNREGNFYNNNNNDKIELFQHNIELLANKCNIGKEGIKECLEFIYLVRCNLFHGVKGFCELTHDSQANRFKFYTEFLHAVAMCCIESISEKVCPKQTY